MQQDRVQTQSAQAGHPARPVGMIEQTAHNDHDSPASCDSKIAAGSTPQ
jgi:hypothetical protein